MAAGSLGALSYGYTRNITPLNNEVVWVMRQYNPTEQRTKGIVPVPRHKFLYPSPEKLQDVPRDWCLDTDRPIYSYSAPLNQQRIYPSTHATRCEEWSTLRQNLPTRELFERKSGPNWGVGKMPVPPKTTDRKAKRYPHINSPMTRYGSTQL